MECEILAGFVGLTQNKNKSNLKPEISLVIRPAKKNNPRSSAYQNMIKI